jgi:hypothetical protein
MIYPDRPDQHPVHERRREAKATAAVNHEWWRTQALARPLRTRAARKAISGFRCPCSDRASPAISVRFHYKGRTGFRHRAGG